MTARELYNLVTDPTELQDVAANNSEKVAKLETLDAVEPASRGYRCPSPTSRILLKLSHKYDVTTRARRNTKDEFTTIALRVPCPAVLYSANQRLVTCHEGY